MKLKEIYNAIDVVAPFALSKEYCEKYDAYDNSGVILDCGGDISRVLFSLDCSAASVQRAKETGAQLLVTHHPAIYLPIASLQADNPVLACAKAGISIISAHFNLDFAKGGVDETLALALGGVSESKMHPLSSGGYGNVFELKNACSLSEFVAHAKEALHSERVLCYGENNVKKVASFCGAGMDENSIRYAFEQGADTFVSSDAKHHLLLQALSYGLNVVLLTHYSAENLGLYALYEKIKKTLTGVHMEYFTDERLL